MLGGACSPDALSARISERKDAEFADTHCGAHDDDGTFRTLPQISVPQFFSFLPHLHQSVTYRFVSHPILSEAVDSFSCSFPVFDFLRCCESATKS